MIGKLAKYEFRATARLYLPLYLVMVVFALLGRLSLWKVYMSGTEDLLGGTSVSVGAAVGGSILGKLLGFLASMVLVLYVLVVLGALVVHFIITLQRFWKNLMGDEGYLMFTLPVTTGELLWSKAICAFVWSIATTLMVLAAVAILAWHPWVVDVLRAEWAEAAPEFQGYIWQIIQNIFPPLLRPLLVLELIINGFGKLFLLYAAMAIGHTVKRHKVLASLGAYAAITTVIGTAASLVMGALLPAFADGVSDIELFVTTQEMMLFTRQLGGFLTAVWIVVMALDLAVTVGSFLLARHLLTTQLNLE